MDNLRAHVDRGMTIPSATAYASRSACITLTLLLLVVLSIELINTTAWALNCVAQDFI